MNSGWQSGYYAGILNDKNDHGLWNLSTGKQFVSFFVTSTRNGFTFLPRMHKVSTSFYLHASLTQWACKVCGCTIDCSLPCYSKWWRSIQIFVHFPFYVWLHKVLRKVYSSDSLCQSWPTMQTFAKLPVQLVWSSFSTLHSSYKSVIAWRCCLQK